MLTITCYKFFAELLNPLKREACEVQQNKLATWNKATQLQLQRGLLERIYQRGCQPASRASLTEGKRGNGVETREEEIFR